jgi:hypothetical protein
LIEICIAGAKQPLISCPAAAAADALADQWGVDHFLARRALRQKAEITGRTAQQ